MSRIPPEYASFFAPQCSTWASGSRPIIDPAQSLRLSDTAHKRVGRFLRRPEH